MIVQENNRVPRLDSWDTGKAASVIICTYNRAEALDQVLAGLSVQTAPANSFEILVVDNNSTDHTREIVERWGSKLPNLRYLFESRQGLSYARNRGLEEAQAPIIAFLDDDAVPEPPWLSSLLTTYQTITPAPAAVGGKILLRWEGGQRPAWMHPDLMHSLGFQDYGEEIRQVPHINGGNMSFRADLVRRYGGFDVRLGRRGEAQFTSEESELQLHLRQDGHSIYYQPQAVVWHLIGRERQRPEYFLNRFYGHGVSDAMRYKLHRWPGRYDLAKLMVRQLVRDRVVLRQALLLRLSGKAFSASEALLIRCHLAQLMGYERQMAHFFVKGNPA